MTIQSYSRVTGLQDTSPHYASMACIPYFYKYNFAVGYIKIYFIWMNPAYQVSQLTLYDCPVIIGTSHSAKLCAVFCSTW